MASENANWLTDIKEVLTAYEEVAAQRMQKIRASVVFNRQFMAELNSMYNQVRISYKNQIAKLKIKGPAKNGKTIRVFISASSGLYGDIVNKVFDLFLTEINKYPSDIAIVGSVGKTLFEREDLRRSLNYFDLPDNLNSPEQAKQIFHFLSKYEIVILYHGIFRNLVRQEAYEINIGGAEVPKTPQFDQPIKIIFEPALPKILKFFETEIFSSLLLHSFYEAQLAKYASRMLSLDTAEDKIRKLIKLNALDEQEEVHRDNNRRQQSLIIGTHFWQAQ